ncbi:MAG: lytic transglycosylase [Desulfobulbus propionicus]|nr:MAG: lytic transglycosylase [Desulfobulbus propionicus]
MSRLFVQFCFLFFLLAPITACADSDFQKWIADFYRTAAKNGISRKVYDRAFSGVTTVNAKVLESAQYQPEFTLEIWDYLDTRVNFLSVSRGRRLLGEHKSTLGAIERKYGVPESVLLSIWSMESNYGAIFNRPGRLHYIPHALATLAFSDKKRSRFASSQLLAALQILQSGDIQRQDFMGSWAGAMGHTQFIPTSYLAYGVDMDGDGRRDIWHSIPDALATAANLLYKNKWQRGKTWGYEVLSPGTNKQDLVGSTRTLAEWERLGFKRANGKPFPRPQDKAILKMPGGRKGPFFLMLKNFFVIKKYNNSDFYALAVSLLADQIAGFSPVKQEWPRPPEALNAAEKLEVQRLLKKKGYYAGEIDGYIGSGTREAIRFFQKKAGLSETGKVNRELLKALQDE